MEPTHPETAPRPPMADQVNSLQHFQQHSRLHFIGQWKTRMEDVFRDWFLEHPEWNHGTLSQQRTFLHVDMDAFFCAVQLAKPQYAHLRSKPVGIAAGKFNSDISSCNYVARSRGVHAGMYVNAAKEVCPDLVTIGYDLEACGNIAKELYRLLFELFPSAAHMSVEVYSIDEVMIATDTTDYDLLLNFCRELREELVRRTGCTASCGIGGNIMLARLATAQAKPDGIQVILPKDIPLFMKTLPFSDIHGAGHNTVCKVEALLNTSQRGPADAEVTCGQVQELTKDALQQALGKKAGESFYNLVRGIDPRVVLRTGDIDDQRALGRGVPNAVGCSMNYAVRPTCRDDVWSIVKQLLDDVCVKLKRGDLSTHGLRVTLLERHPLHPKETQKYMGRGKCVEVHIPVRFPHPLDDTHEDVMLRLVKEIVEPLLVDARPITDRQRAEQLGLDDNMESQVIWTVTLATLDNIIVSDLRGMTIQASGLKAKKEEPIRAKRDRGQLSLAAAFSRVKESRSTVSPVPHPHASFSDSSSSSSVETLSSTDVTSDGELGLRVERTELSDTNQPAVHLAMTHHSDFQALLSIPIWADFATEWRATCSRSLAADNTPLTKALLRLAMLKAAMEGRTKDEFAQITHVDDHVLSEDISFY